MGQQIWGEKKGPVEWGNKKEPVEPKGTSCIKKGTVKVLKREQLMLNEY